MILPGPLPDLASTLRLQRDASAVRDDLERTGRELSTGRKEDLYAASGGDPARLFAIDAARSRAQREGEGVALAQARIGAVQTALGGLETLADELGVELAASVARDDMAAARLHAEGAGDAFASAVQILNTRYGGRALFAGAAVDGPALADADVILADVSALVNGAADAADAIAQVEAYFDPGGGFETTGYIGSTADAPLAAIDGGGAVAITRRADDAEIRTLLRGLALAAVTVDGAYSGPPDAIPDLLAEAADVTMQADEALVQSRASLGLSEARLEEANVRLAARRDALEIAWSRIASRDPFDAAAEFQALEQQLQRVFTVTARLAELNFNDFIR